MLPFKHVLKWVPRGFRSFRNLFVHQQNYGKTIQVAVPRTGWSSGSDRPLYWSPTPRLLPVVWLLSISTVTWRHVAAGGDSTRLEWFIKLGNWWSPAQRTEAEAKAFTISPRPSPTSNEWSFVESIFPAWIIQRWWAWLEDSVDSGRQLTGRYQLEPGSDKWIVLIEFWLFGKCSTTTVAVAVASGVIFILQLTADDISHVRTTTTTTTTTWLLLHFSIYLNKSLRGLTWRR